MLRYTIAYTNGASSICGKKLKSFAKKNAIVCHGCGKPDASRQYCTLSSPNTRIIEATPVKPIAMHVMLPRFKISSLITDKHSWHCLPIASEQPSNTCIQNAPSSLGVLKLLLATVTTVCAKKNGAVARESLRRDRPVGFTSPAFHACDSASPIRACKHSGKKHW